MATNLSPWHPAIRYFTFIGEYSTDGRGFLVVIQSDRWLGSTANELYSQLAAMAKLLAVAIDGDFTTAGIQLSVQYSRQYYCGTV